MGKYSIKQLEKYCDLHAMDEIKALEKQKKQLLHGNTKNRLGDDSNPYSPINTMFKYNKRTYYMNNHAVDKVLKIDKEIKNIKKDCEIIL